MIKLRFLLFIVGAVLMGRGVLFSQDRTAPSAVPSGLSAVTGDIERGVLGGDVAVFSKHFAKQVYVDLPDQDAAYFSDRQLYYVLQSFFGSRSAQQFRFTTVDESESGYYATGSGSFFHRGTREVLQIYVAFARVGGRTVITQFNVY